jgi:hypothetical protein
MQWIADALITGLFITDFTIHDTGFIRRTNAKTPFMWIVYESGTHIYAIDNEKEIRDFLQILDYYERYSHKNFCLYRYDGNKLIPVFPSITRLLIESELDKLLTTSNN